MFCENCSLSSSGDTVCKIVKTLLNTKRIFKTTFFEEEIGLIEASGNRCFYQVLQSVNNNYAIGEEESYDYWLSCELSDMPEDVDEDWYLDSYDNWLSYVKWHRRRQFQSKWMKFVKIIEAKLTTEQYVIIWWYLDGISINEISKRLGISDQAVNYAIFGHPRHGGCNVKKVQKELDQEDYNLRIAW